MHGMKLIGCGRAWASAQLLGDAAAACGDLSAENPDVSALRLNRETKLCFLMQRRAFFFGVVASTGCARSFTLHD